MKLFKFAIMFFWILLFTFYMGSLSFAQVKTAKAPDGMGDLKWGDPTLKFRELTNPPPDGLSDEDKDGERIGTRTIPSIGHINLLGRCIYFFHKDRYYHFRVSFKGERDFNDLKYAMSLKYGEPTEKPLVLKVNPNAQTGIECTWDLENKVEMKLGFNDLKEEGFLSYTFKPIRKELIEGQMKSAEKLMDSL